MKRRLSTLLLALAALACSPDPVVEDADKTRLMEQVTAYAKSNDAQTCTRPVLHGLPAKPGSGEDAVRAVVTLSNHEACYEKVRGIALKSASADDLAAVVAACADVPRASRDAASYSGTCAPFRLGRAAYAQDDTSTIVAYGKASTLMARAAREGGRPEEAMGILLDAMRVLYDVQARSNMLIGLSASGALHSVQAELAKLLAESPAPLGEAALAALERDLDALIGVFPKPHEPLLEELYQSQAYFALPVASPSWEPPGASSIPGAAEYEAPTEEQKKMSTRDEDFGLDLPVNILAIDVPWVVALVNERHVSVVEKACGGATYMSCHAALAAYEREAEERSAKAIQELDGFFGVKEASLETNLDALEADPALSQLRTLSLPLQFHGTALAELHALRGQVAVRRSWEATGTCDFESAKAAWDSALGDVTIKNGAVTQPEWMRTGGQGWILLELGCPKTAAVP